jgi:glycosyltransferase involved in cell wall biosynthesis
VKRRVLLVSYYYPPDPSVGSHRWAALGRYLKELGHDVCVITTSAFGTLPDDGDAVLRTADLTASPILRRILRRPPLPKDGLPAAVVAPIPRLLLNGVVPDPWAASWLPFALRSARARLRREPYDCIVTNSRPNSIHLLGLLLGSRRPAWVADFEDGWRFDPLSAAWPTRAQDRLDAALEARVVRSADGIVCASPATAADFSRRFAVEADYIPLGWDPELETELIRAPAPDLDQTRVNLVHTGALTDTTGRDPRPLFAALHRLAEEHPGSADRIRVVLAGPLSADERRILDESRLGDLVTHIGALPRASALALQRHADALLMLTGEQVSKVPGKVCEYLAASRPIIALARAGDEGARIVRETCTGITVAPDDLDGVLDALRSAADGRLTDSYRPANLERYRYPAPAEAFAQAIERALAATRARAAR